MEQIVKTVKKSPTANKKILKDFGIIRRYQPPFRTTPNYRIKPRQITEFEKSPSFLLSSKHLKNRKLHKKITDSLPTRKLQAKGAALIEGAKWCGKTTTAEEMAASKVILIDEWQTVPKLWDAVRHTVDHRHRRICLPAAGRRDIRSAHRMSETLTEHSGLSYRAYAKTVPN